MLMEKARIEVVEYGKRLLSDGLTEGTAGNISVYDPECGCMAISPSGVAYPDTRPEDVVIMDLEGNVFDGDRRPSSEHALHSVFYKTRPGARAVVHTHSMYCTTLACMGVALESVHYAIADAGVTRIPLAPYRTFGTPELAQAVADTLCDGKAVLMKNHGMIACGDSIRSAYSLAKTCEWCAEIQWRAMAAGKPSLLSGEEMREAIARYADYGQTPGKSTGYFS